MKRYNFLRELPFTNCDWGSKNTFPIKMLNCIRNTRLFQFKCAFYLSKKFSLSQIGSQPASRLTGLGIYGATVCN